LVEKFRFEFFRVDFSVARLSWKSFKVVEDSQRVKFDVLDLLVGLDRRGGAGLKVSFVGVVADAVNVGDIRVVKLTEHNLLLFFHNVTRADTNGRAIFRVKRTIQEEMEIEHVRFIVGGEDRVRGSTSASTGTTTNAMNEKLRFTRKVKVDNVVETGDVDTACGNVCND
jgi:hypothetical protein